jgi:hypothetical protein
MAKFDLEKTGELGELFQTPSEQRTDEWRDRFLAAVTEASLISFDPQVQRGPDSFPYFQLAMPAPGPMTPFCIAHILDDCLEYGLGAVVFGDAERSGNPEWVFSYGDLLSFSLYGEFYRPMDATPPAKGAGGQVLLASPSEEYYPERARKVLGKFLRDVFHHPAPKVGFLVSHELSPRENLVVNLRLEHYDGDKGKLDAALRYVRWFVPGHYGLMAQPPGIDDTNFAAL